MLFSGPWAQFAPTPTTLITTSGSVCGGFVTSAKLFDSIEGHATGLIFDTTVKLSLCVCLLPTASPLSASWKLSIPACHGLQERPSELPLASISAAPRGSAAEGVRLAETSDAGSKPKEPVVSAAMSLATDPPSRPTIGAAVLIDASLPIEKCHAESCDPLSSN